MKSTIHTDTDADIEIFKIVDTDSEIVTDLDFFRSRTQTHKWKCFKPRILTRTRTFTFEQITDMDMSIDTPRTISKIEKNVFSTHPILKKRSCGEFLQVILKLEFVFRP